MIAAGADRADRTWLGNVDSAVKGYVKALLGIDSYEDSSEQRMREEYERVRLHNPRIYKDSGGQATVEGVS